MIQRLIGVVAAALTAGAASAAPMATFGIVSAGSSSFGQDSFFALRNDSTPGILITQVQITLPGALYFGTQSPNPRVFRVDGNFDDVVGADLTAANATYPAGPTPNSATINFTAGFDPTDTALFDYVARDPSQSPSFESLLGSGITVKVTFSDNSVFQGLTVAQSVNITSDGFNEPFLGSVILPEPVALSAVGLLGLTMLRRRSA